ncbi:MAG TPA: prolyl oligopeptidase family serine peptidase [Acidobacteriota bacterium]|nr:prolyl oligopeptidase family serine peptidase [Acidobacteriota bacterium]
MSRRTAVAALAAAVLWTSGCGQSDVRAPKRYRAESFVKAAEIRGGAFSPDGRQVLFAAHNPQGVFNAYLVDVDGGEPEALTDSRQEHYPHAFFPHDRRLLLGRVAEEGKAWHLFLLTPQGDERDLTPDALTSVEFRGFSRDLKSFHYLANPRDDKEFDLFEMDVETLASRTLFRNEGGYVVGPVSDDRRYVALHKLHSIYESDLYVWDRHEKVLKHLSASLGEVYLKPVAFGVANHDLYYLSDEGGEFNYLMRLDLDSGRGGKVEEARWDILFAEFSRTGRYRLVGVNDPSGTRIRVYNTASGERIPIEGMPRGQVMHLQMSADEERLALLINSSRSASNLFVYDFQEGQLRQLTRALPESMDPQDLVEPEIVSFASYDGLAVPGLFYRPKGVDAESKAPGLIFVHGGPGGQFRVRYSPLVQYLVNQGYAVLQVNNRGSTGYGKTFASLDDRRHGKEDLKDCLAGKKFLIESGLVQPDRIGIIGGSYGGFLVLSALAFHPGEFRVGVDLFGVVNWISTLQSIPPWQESMRKVIYTEVGDPEQDAEYLKSISPLYHADKIRSPLLVVQGAKDPRVSAEEKRELVDAVERNGVPVEYLVFDNEEHIVSRPQNRVKLYKTVLKFLQVHLKK